MNRRVELVEITTGRETAPDTSIDELRGTADDVPAPPPLERSARRRRTSDAASAAVTGCHSGHNSLDDSSDQKQILLALLEPSQKRPAQ